MAGASPTVPGPLRYAGAGACAFAVLVGSLVDSGEGASSTVLGLPVTAYLHVLGYAVLSAALCYAMLADDRRALLLAALVATTYGGLLELLQGTLPHRTTAAADGLLNAIGACAGVVVWQRASTWFARRD